MCFEYYKTKIIIDSMKKLIFALFITTILTACSSKIYNSALQKIELGMTQEQVIDLMGNDYTVTNEQIVNNQEQVTLRYIDYFKNQWYFNFLDNRLVKWYKVAEPQK